VTVSVVEASGLAVIASVVAWSLLRIAGEDSLFPPTAEEAVSVTAPAAARLAPADQSLLAALEQAMTVDRVYRQDGLTIGRLARQHGVPEYRLRRLINQGLGYRNFNSFLNRYRIAEAKAALADPSQAAVPIVTIALDTGFGSLGPFNRAFKAETGLTPSDYRRRTGGGPAMAPADSGISQGISASAGQTSSSARTTMAGAS
jgi:AraC-like DNA-binding protein